LDPRRRHLEDPGDRWLRHQWTELLFIFPF
jgi:hypothetical protein